MTFNGGSWPTTNGVGGMVVWSGLPSYSTLYGVVGAVRYKPGWTFGFHGGAGDCLFLRIDVETVDPVTREAALVGHRMPVPWEPWTADQWVDWVFQQILLIEGHEAGEFFTVGGERPYLPEHGPGVDVYALQRRPRL